MNWEKFISNRFYQSSNYQGKYLGILSMIGMGVGCFAMLVSISVMNGFETLVHEKLKGIEGDIRIIGTTNEKDLSDIKGVKGIMPFMERKGIIEVNDLKRVALIKAIDETKMANFYDINIQGYIPKLGQIVIGKDLAYRLGKDVGDILYVYSPIDQAVGFSLPSKKKLQISGIFSTKILDYDERLVFIPLKDGQNIFKRKLEFDGFDIRTENENGGIVKTELENKLGPEYSIFTWDEQNKSLVNAMKMERLGTMVVLCLIFLVAAFNLAANLTLISIQKMKEVGVIRAMGAPIKSIYRIIILLGLKRAGIGLLFGFLIGILLILIQNYFNLIPLPSNVYFIDSLPMVIYMSDILIILGVSLLFILIASLSSGRKLIKIQINESIQWVK